MEQRNRRASCLVFALSRAERTPLKFIRQLFNALLGQPKPRLEILHTWPADSGVDAWFDYASHFTPLAPPTWCILLVHVQRVFPREMLEGTSASDWFGWFCSWTAS